MVNFTALGFCNSTLEFEHINETPLWKGYTFHQFGLVLSAAFGLLAIVMSVYLMMMHATHYSRPEEQKHILRILFMVPIYSLVSFLSYYYYVHTVYYQVLRDCYEAFAIASFFSLICAYIAPDLHEQKEYFRGIRPRRWVWPASWGKKEFLRTPRSGLTWFNIIWFCVFQYCFINVLMTMVSVITEATGRYCIDSLSPAFAHVWVTCFQGVSVTVAMYAVIQFFLQLRGDISEHKPGIKVASIKLVIFFSFWQTLVIDFLVSSGALKPSATISAPDFRVGLPDLLLCIEMAGFALLHLFAYPWRVYDVARSQRLTSESAPGYDADPKTAYRGGRFGYKAFLEAYNFWDIIKATARSVRWMFVGRKTRESDISYKGRLGGVGDPSYGDGTMLADREGNKVVGKYTKLDDPLLPSDGARADSPDHGAGSYDPDTKVPTYEAPTYGAAGAAPYADTAQSHYYRDSSPNAQDSRPYGGRQQAYGVTHPAQRPGSRHGSRPGSRPGTSGGSPPVPPAGSFGYESGVHVPPAGSSVGYAPGPHASAAYPGAQAYNPTGAGAWGADGGYDVR